MHSPFKMPDFTSRPDGESKSLKEAYISLRRSGFPDKDIFVYALGEFYKFKGEILKQQPQAGDTIYPGDRIVLGAAVSGICHIMPDLFTDHTGESLSEEKNPRQGAKRLFSIIDSAFLKMLCRLEWIRDIYAGVYYSETFIDYLNSIFFFSGGNAARSDFDSYGFVPSRLARFLGTEGGLRVFYECAFGLRVNAVILGNQKTRVPDLVFKCMGEEVRLGENAFIGEEFEGERPEIRFDFQLDKPADVAKAIGIKEDYKLLEDMFRFILPYYIGLCEVSVDPRSVGIEFETGNSHLGFVKL